MNKQKILSMLEQIEIHLLETLKNENINNEERLQAQKTLLSVARCYRKIDSYLKEDSKI